MAASATLDRGPQRRIDGADHDNDGNSELRSRARTSSHARHRRTRSLSPSAHDMMARTIPPTPTRLPPQPPPVAQQAMPPRATATFTDDRSMFSRASLENAAAAGAVAGAKVCIDFIAAQLEGPSESEPHGAANQPSLLIIPFSALSAAYLSKTLTSLARRVPECLRPETPEGIAVVSAARTMISAGALPLLLTQSWPIAFAVGVAAEMAKLAFFRKR